MIKISPENINLLFDLGIAGVVLINGIYLLRNIKKMKKVEKQLEVLASKEK